MAVERAQDTDAGEQTARAAARWERARWCLSWVLLALAHIATSVGLHRAQRRNQPPPTA